MEVQDRVRKFREKKGLSTTELSKLTGISQSTISKLENGKRKADLEILEKIAHALGISVDRLTGESASSIIEERLEEIGMTLEELGEKSGVSPYWLQNLDTFVPWDEEDEIGYIWISKIAKVLELPGSKLRAALARQEPPVYGGSKTSALIDFNKIEESGSVYEASFVIREVLNDYGKKKQNECLIPVLGSIPAGVSIEAIEDIIGWEEIPVDWLNGDREHFGLKVKGDSMYPEYLEGDTVIIRKQQTCDSGDDCAVIINGTDATLKRVHRLKDGIELEAINPMYGKKRFSNKEVESLPVIILGVVVELRRKKK
ncbi:S24 family peptidase [Syntrophomonas erecta subsp. sporosyntropha]